MQFILFERPSGRVDNGLTAEKHHNPSETEIAEKNYEGRIVKLTLASEKGVKQSKQSHCRDRVAPLVGCLGSEDPQRGA